MKHFWDLDGFMFDFDGHFEDLFGVHADTFKDNKKEMWKLINSVPTFFLDLPLMPGAREFYNDYAPRVHPAFLTSCPTSDYERVADQKRKAVRRHFGYNNLMLPTVGPKELFMHAPGDILIDDWSKNLVPWEKAGGIAIKHESFGITRAHMDWHLRFESRFG